MVKYGGQDKIHNLNDNKMEPILFETAASLRKWFIKNHLKEKELIVGFYKVGSGKASVTWSEAVDQALCFGWIDGIRRSIDEESYSNRFTPRKPASNWSAINIRKVEELKKKGLMSEEGLAAFDKRTESRSAIYSYEKEPEKLEREFKKRFKANKKAWAFFQSTAPSYQKACINWVVGARQEATRLSHLEELIRDSEAGQKIKQFRNVAKKKLKD